MITNERLEQLRNLYSGPGLEAAPEMVKRRSAEMVEIIEELLTFRQIGIVIPRGDKEALNKYLDSVRDRFFEESEIPNIRATADDPLGLGSFDLADIQPAEQHSLPRTATGAQRLHNEQIWGAK